MACNVCMLEVPAPRRICIMLCPRRLAFAICCARTASHLHYAVPAPPRICRQRGILGLYI